MPQYVDPDGIILDGLDLSQSVFGADILIAQPLSANSMTMLIEPDNGSNYPVTTIDLSTLIWGFSIGNGTDFQEWPGIDVGSLGFGHPTPQNIGPGTYWAIATLSGTSPAPGYSAKSYSMSGTPSALRGATISTMSSYGPLGGQTGTFGIIDFRLRLHFVAPTAHGRAFAQVIG